MSLLTGKLSMLFACAMSEIIKDIFMSCPTRAKGYDVVDGPAGPTLPS